MKFTIVRREGNEILLTGDSTDQTEGFVTNMDQLSYFFGDDAVNSILVGMEVSQASVPDLTVRLSAGIGCDVSTNELLLGEAVTGLAISTPDPTNDRYDTIECQRLTEDTNPESRQFKDAGTGIISTLIIDTKTEYSVQYQVVTGTPGAGVAPSATSGWMKVAEVYVPAGSSTVIDANIYNVDAIKPGDSNTSWTTEAATAYRVGSMGDLKAFIDEKCYPSGSGFAAGEVLVAGGTDGRAVQTSNTTITSGGTMGDSSTIVPTEDRIAAFLSDPSFIKWTSPQLVGTGKTIAGLDIAALAPLNGTDVVIVDSAYDELRIYRFDGSTWSKVGSDFSISGIGNPALAALNGTDVAFIDSDLEELRTYRFNGSTWSLIGTGLSISGIGIAALAALNGTDVAFIDSAYDELRIYRFDGSTWSKVGSDFSISGIRTPALAALNGTDVALIDGGLDELRTYRFNGSTWSLIGTGLSIPGAIWPALAALNGTDVAFIDSDLEELRIYRFDGSTWSKVGSDFSISGIGNPALAALNGTDVAFIDSDLEELRIYRFDFQIAKMMPHSVSGGAF